MHESRIAPGVTWGLNGFLTELQKPLRVRETTLLLGVAGCGKEKDFGGDVFALQFATFNFRRIVPKAGRFGFNHFAHDEPFQFRQRFAFEPGMLAPDGWILKWLVV